MTQKGPPEKDKEKDLYDAGAYRRLELIEKQFAANQAEQRKQQAIQKRRERFVALKPKNVKIGRIVLYGLLAILLVAVIIILIKGR
jgi:hypothetical protein